MEKVDWSAEPDLEQLERIQQTFSKSPEAATPDLLALTARGSALAPLYLGNYHVTERQGKAADEMQAAFWYKIAHERGIGQASYMLGRLLHRKQDSKGAFDAFKTGAERGYLPAMYRAAKMHQDADGTEMNFDEAIRLLRLAEAEGHIFSRRDLAGLMIAGKLGKAAIPKGAAMMAKLTADIAWMVRQAAKPGGMHSERILA